MIQVTWTGAAGLIFETEKEIILIDPYYTRVNVFNTLLGTLSPDEKAITNVLDSLSSKISAVIVGHTHSDHAMDVPCIIQKTGAKPVGSRSLESLMSVSGMSGITTVCQGGETVVLSDHASVTMVRSTHGKAIMNKVPFDGEILPDAVLPLKAGGYRAGTVFAPKLQIDGIRFLHVGSAGFIEAQVQGHVCEVLFLCVAGWNKCQGYPQRLIELTRPGKVVLVHYDNFSRPHRKGRKTHKLPFLDIKGMVRSIKARSPSVEVLIPEIYEVLRFD
jgi:L-ascorbate metabolism protein UlaG (beta-lactamase superfamily)